MKESPPRKASEEVGSRVSGQDEDSSGGYTLPAVEKRAQHGAQALVAGGSQKDPLASENEPETANTLGVTKKGHTKKNEAPGAGDLCLGMSFGVSDERLVTFVASFREAAPLADLILFLEAPASARSKEITEK